MTVKTCNMSNQISFSSSFFLRPEPLVNFTPRHCRVFSPLTRDYTYASFTSVDTIQTPTPTAPNPNRQCNRGNRPGHKPPLVQIVDWQQSLNEAREKGDVTLVRLASGAKAWCALELLKRGIRMQPMPRPVDVQLPMRKQKRSAAIADEPSAPAPLQTPQTPAQCCQQPAAGEQPPTPANPAPDPK